MVYRIKLREDKAIEGYRYINRHPTTVAVSKTGEVYAAGHKFAFGRVVIVVFERHSTLALLGDAGRLVLVNDVSSKADDIMRDFEELYKTYVAQTRKTRENAKAALEAFWVKRLAPELHQHLYPGFTQPSPEVSFAKMTTFVLQR